MKIINYYTVHLRWDTYIITTIRCNIHVIYILIKCYMEYNYECIYPTLSIVFIHFYQFFPFSNRLLWKFMTYLGLKSECFFMNNKIENGNFLMRCALIWYKNYWHSCYIRKMYVIRDLRSSLEICVYVYFKYTNI